jgi:hypothetical protein
MDRKPYPQIPGDGYMFQVFADDRDPGQIPNDDWEICIPTSLDREGAEYIGRTIIDGSPCNVWHVGGGAAPDAFLACTVVFSGGH